MASGIEVEALAAGLAAEDAVDAVGELGVVDGSGRVSRR
jgi:hypothetical protein